MAMCKLSQDIIIIILLMTVIDQFMFYEKNLSQFDDTVSAVELLFFGNNNRIRHGFETCTFCK